MEKSEQAQRIEFIKNNIKFGTGRIGVSTLNTLARMLGLDSEIALRKIVKGNAEISFELAQRISHFCPACTIEWLMHGTGTPPESPILIIYERAKYVMSITEFEYFVVRNIIFTSTDLLDRDVYSHSYITQNHRITFNYDKQTADLLEIRIIVPSRIS